MTTEAQINATRANAQKSTGPCTPEGKAVVAQNAVQHGLLARAAVLQGEDWEEYTCFHEEMMDELYPDGMQEEELAERIVDLSWRLRRAGRYQNAVFEALYDKYAGEPADPGARPEPIPSVPSDPVLGRMLLADFSGDRVLERVLLYERRIESSLYRARAELRNLRKERRVSREERSVKGQVSSLKLGNEAPSHPASHFRLPTPLWSVKWHGNKTERGILRFQNSRTEFPAWRFPCPPRYLTAALRTGGRRRSHCAKQSQFSAARIGTNLVTDRSSPARRAGRPLVAPKLGPLRMKTGRGEQTQSACTDRRTRAGGAGSLVARSRIVQKKPIWRGV